MRTLAASIGPIVFALTPASAQSADEVGSVVGDQAPVYEEIVVTAQRRESLLSDTPLALSAISGDDLLSLGVTDPTNLGNLVPNLSLDRGAQNGLQITIRGVTSNDSTEKGDPSASFLVDGIVLARPQVQEVSFFDLERVEVLRGPQGTLFGRNSTAGVVHLITAKPKDEFEASLNATYGNFDTRQATGVLNVPVNERLAVRAAVNYDRRDSYLIDGAADGFTLDPTKENLSTRLSASFDITDSVDLTLIGDYTSQEGALQDDLLLSNFFPTAAPFAVPQNSAPEFDPGGSDERRTLAIPQLLQSERDSETYGITGELNANFGPGTLTYLGSYRDFNRSEAETGILGLVPVQTDADYSQQSHELRYAFEVGALQAQAGVYYFREESSIDVVVDNAAVIVPGVPGVEQFGVRQAPTIAESIAVFGQTTYSITDKLRLTGGIRFTNDEKSRVGVTFITNTFVGDGQVEIPINSNDAAVEFDEVTWRVGIDYDTRLGLAYAAVSSGYKAGGFNDGCEIGTQPGCTQPADLLFYDPETIISYEAGLKFGFLDDRVRLNASGFFYDYEDLQLSTVQPVNGVPTILIVNATSADVLGFELDAVIRPTLNHQFDFALTLLSAEFNDFSPIPGVDFSGRDLDRAPNVTFTAGYAYTQPLSNGGDIVARARIKFTDDYTVTDFGDAISFEQENNTRTDVSIAYSSPDERYTAQLYANNLENNNVITFATAALGGALNISDPRTYGLRLGVNF